MKNLVLFAFIVFFFNLLIVGSEILMPADFERKPDPKLVALLQNMVGAASRRDQTKIRTLTVELTKLTGSGTFPDLISTGDSISLGKPTPSDWETFSKTTARTLEVVLVQGNDQKESASSRYYQLAIGVNGLTTCIFTIFVLMRIIKLNKNETAAKHFLNERNQELARFRELNEARNSELLQLRNDNTTLRNDLISERATGWIDPLTGLHLRRPGEMQFDQLILREFGRNPIWVVFFDIDKFKVVNDTYGHAVGDTALREVSNCLLKSIRTDSDLPIRWGGEELVVILPGCTEREVSEIIHRIQVAVQRAVVWDSEGNPIKSQILSGACLTISSGSSEISEIGEQWDSVADALKSFDGIPDMHERLQKRFEAAGGVRKLLVELADQRLYSAKTGGRNQHVGPDTVAIRELFKSRYRVSA